MNTKQTLILITIIVLVALGAGLTLQTFLPEKVASHWDALGQVNGYTSRSFGIYFMPGIMAMLAVVLMFVPKLDPLKANIVQFLRVYNRFVATMMLFLLYIHFLTLFWNLDIRFNMTQVIAPAFGVLIYMSGVLLGKARRNYLIGIRTPWTMHSDFVWDKTHARGAIAFKICGFLSFLGLLFPGAMIPLLLAPLLLVTIYLLAYSYWVYRKEEAQKDNQV